MNATGYRRRFSGFLAIALLSLAGCAGYSQTETEEFDLSRYDRIMVDPVSVSLAKDGIPGSTGSHLPATESEVKRIKQDISELFHDAFREELGGGQLVLVDNPGPGVLRITPELVDLRLNSPLTHPSNSLETYVRGIGEVTLNATFRDSQSGEVLLTLYDSMRGSELGLLRPATPVYTRLELTRIFEDWAQIIREDILRAR